MSSIDLWYATRATGLAALVLLSVTMLLGILTAGRAKSSLPAFARVEIHRRVSILTVAFLAIHVLTSVLDTYVDINWTAIVVPFTSGYHTFWLALGTIGVDLFIAVAVSSALRQYISARAWRLVHWLAYLSWPVAVAHSLGMGTDSGLPWVLALVATCIAGVVGLAVWRVADAFRQRSHRPTTITPPRPSLRAGLDPSPATRGVQP
jgi:sulfoxide reductase heme-binding subunit YedZ